VIILAAPLFNQYPGFGQRREDLSIFVAIPSGEQTSLCSVNVDFHFIEKAKGIKYWYAWLDKHPNVRTVVGKKVHFFSYKLLVQ